MRQFFRWTLPVALVAIAAPGCSTQQQARNSMFGPLSSRTPPQATTPAQLASHQPQAAPSAPPGGYQASYASASRNAQSNQRFQLPKCLSSG